MNTTRVPKPIRTFEDLPREMPVSDDLTLKLAFPDDVPRIAANMTDNWEHLAPYTRLDVTVSGIDEAQLRRAYQSGQAVDYMMIFHDEFAGLTGLHSRRGTALKLGYWVVKDRQRKGLATASAARVRDLAFDEFGAERAILDIKQTNVPSKVVAARLGASFAGFGKKEYERWVINRTEHEQTRQAG